LSASGKHFFIFFKKGFFALDASGLRQAISVTLGSSVTDTNVNGHDITTSPLLTSAEIIMALRHWGWDKPIALKINVLNDDKA
jgi:hypothetical protein